MRRAKINRIFIPDFCGNLDLQESEQVTVECDLANIEERDRFSVVKYGKKGDISAVKKVSSAVLKKVTKISNYEDDEGNPINTAEKLITDANSGAKESIDLSMAIYRHVMGLDIDEEDEEGESEA